MLRREHTRTVERVSEKENERCASEASACVVRGADLRREHTRAVERVALGEGSEAKRERLQERSVSKTRDGKETKGKENARGEREEKKERVTGTVTVDQ